MTDLSMKSKIVLAEAFFWGRIERIRLTNKSGRQSNLKQNYLRKHWANANYVTALAVLALFPASRRVCGTIDTLPLDGFDVQRNQKSSWIVFPYQGEEYVYDPCLERVIPRETWYELCNPRNITYDKDLDSIVKQFVRPEYAVKISDGHWVFKSKEDVEPLLKNKEDIVVFDALQEGNLRIRWDCTGGEITSFDAYDTREL